MQVAERPAPAQAQARPEVRGTMKAPASRDLDVVLKPLARPELGDIRIDDTLAIGRNDAPFANYDRDLVGMLSRRHARVFHDSGAVYLADLSSRNGTTVNRANLGQEPCRLRDGDEICFAGVLPYRVEIVSRAPKADEGLAVTLTPECVGSGLEPIVITRFPIVVSKTDEAFTRRRSEHASQLAYLSRRQAHIFLKQGAAFIEDLSSTNGTFVEGQRLQDVAVPLKDGMQLAFGGEFFVYRVGIRGGAQIPVQGPAQAAPAPARAAAKPAPAVAAPAAPAAAPAPAPSSAGKTTFVVAPTSFLDIFCEQRASEVADKTGGDGKPAAAAAGAVTGPKRPARWRGMAMLTALAATLAGGENQRVRRSAWRGAGLAVAVAAIAVAPSLWHGTESRLKEMLASGDYEQAAVLANQSLAKDPEDLEFKAFATEAALKARLPAWLAKLSAHDFGGAQAVLASMTQLAGHDAELRPLVSELQWMQQLEQLVLARGGAEVPIRIYADEDRIAALLDRWNDNTREHQRALARIASLVPQFGAPYADALTHLRKLQSDATVYLSAIGSLKTAIAAEVSRDSPQAVEPVLKEYAQRYPGLGGLDTVRQDLARYLEIKEQARERRGRLFSLLLNAKLATPPFQEGLRAMTASGQLPPAQLVKQYELSTNAWKAGDTATALDGLQKLASGPWGDAAARELERRQAVVTQFAALQSSREAGGYAEQLLAFRATLDPLEDVHFARATQADMDLQKERVLARAEASMNQARAQWLEYRNGGAIDASQRIETTVSAQYRARARLLSEARRNAQEGMQTFALVDAPRPQQWVVIHDEIRAEGQQQRNALLELRNVLEPQLLKSKLALIGDTNDDAR